jgi:hypothetical protein
LGIKHSAEGIAMSEAWYYAPDGRQLGPVNFVILQQFAASGQLRPTDLVWREGMPHWVQADTIHGLIPPAPAKPPQLPGEPLDSLAALETRLSPPEHVTTFDEPAWKREPLHRPPQRLNTAAKMVIGAALAGCVVVVAVVLIGIAALARQTNPTNPTTFNLRTGEMRTFRITFAGGKRAQIWVTSERNTDVDVFVCQPGVSDNDVEFDFVVKDDGMSKDCYVEWTPSTTQTYQVVVWNRIHMPPMPELEGPNRVTLRYSPNLTEGDR